MTDVNRRFLANHDHLQSLGIEIEEQAEGYVRLSLPFDESLANPGTEIMQGGVVATLIDHAGGAAIRTTLEDPAATPHASTELNVSYVRPASGDLEAEASVVRSGSSMGVVEVAVTTIHEGEPKTVAVGRVSLHLQRE